MSLFHAAVEANKGKQICIVEKSNRLGGAWAVDDALGLLDIETSPHMFLPNQTAYELFDKFLDSRFEELVVQPRLHWQFPILLRPICSVEVRNLKSYAMVLGFSSLLSRSALVGARFLRRGRRLLSLSFRPMKGHPLGYPQGGLSEMFKRAEVRLVESGVLILKEWNATKAVLSEKHVSLFSDAGQEIKANELVLNKHVQLNCIEHVNGVFEPEMKSSKSQHFVFLVACDRDLGFSQFTGHGPLMFANDVSSYCHSYQSGLMQHRLVSARTKASVIIDERAVFDKLVAIGYFSKDVKLIDSSMQTRTVKKFSKRSLSTFSKQFKPKIKLLLADDLSLMNSISKYVAPNK